MSSSIPPKVGRKVWVFGAPGAVLDMTQPFDGTIVFVNGAPYVTVAYRDHCGVQFAQQLPLRDPQPGYSSHDVAETHDGVPRAVWMPFQVGQAKAQALGAVGPVIAGIPSAVTAGVAAGSVSLGTAGGASATLQTVGGTVAIVSGGGASADAIDRGTTGGNGKQ